MKELYIEAMVDKLEQVLSFVDEELIALKCSTKIQTQIDIAVEEIFVNIAHYAYDSKNGHATISIVEEKNPTAVSITFIDNGIPYNPLEKEDPDITLSADERQIGGLGIYMVKKSMDNVDYEYKDGQNIFRIRKIL